MIKKKYFLLLSTLLLTVLLGLSGTCYAKEVTLNEVKNFIINYYKFYYGQNVDLTNIKNYIDSIESDLNGIVNSANASQGRYVLSGANGYVFYWIYDGSTQNLNNYKPYEYQHQIYVNSSYLSRWRKDICIINGSYSFTNWTANYPIIASYVSNSYIYFFYTDSNIYTTSQNGSIKYNAGYMTPSNLFDGIYQDDYFSFALNDNLTMIDIQGDNVPLIEFNNLSDKVLLGGISLAENFDYAELFKYRWYNGNWQLQNIKRVDNVGSISSSDNTLLKVELSPGDYSTDTLYSYQFNSDPDKDFSNYSQPFYVKGRYTKIVNGALDIANTFSGDYYNNYNNDTNTDKIIDNTNDNSQVDNIIAENLSGDANSIANKIGYSPLENPFLSIIQFVLNGICNTLLGSGNVTLEIELHGNTYTINSADFQTPTNALTIFVSALLVTLYLLAFYKFGFKIYEKLQSGDFQSVINNLSSNNNNDWRTM